MKDERVVSAVEVGLLVACLVAIVLLAQGLRRKWDNVSMQIEQVIESSPVTPGQTPRQAN
ncbi:MAG: Flp family type IVb pilin [bacterium]